MKDFTFAIEPKIGYGEIKFGMTSEKILDLLGPADDMENIEDDDEFNTVILYYWDQDLTIFLEGKEKSAISCIETENQDSTLFGKKIFDMDEGQIINLMEEHGYKVDETEMETSGEKRVSYDNAMIDFFFSDGDLIAVNWGVLINDKGEIEEI